jgi:hypothetical protein
MLFRLLPLLTVAALFVSCKKDDTVNNSTAKLIFKFKFDSTQVRLNNIGQPSTITAGNGAQSPVMNKMSVHYIELAPGALTLLGKGAIVYKASETTTGGATAINFEQSAFAGNNETFFELPIKDIAVGEYEWVRISLAYQNADVKYRIDTTINGISINQDVTGTIAGFIGFNTYIKNYTIKNQSIAVNANKAQGYWGFETTLSAAGFSFPFKTDGQAPAGATTVVNPLFATSPIPSGSCVVTAAFTPGKLKITGTETKDVIIEASFSTNKSFEWVDVNNNNKWEPLKGELVKDMGIRGLIPTIK